MDIRRVFFITLLLGLAYLGFNYTLDPDLWWHLSSGRWIAQRGIPFKDVFSFTASGKPWTAHEWLSDLLFWKTESMAGMTGLMVLASTMILAAFYMVYAATPGKPYLAGVLTVLAAGTARVIFGWGLRTQIITLMMVALTNMVIRLVREKRLADSWLWSLPAVMIFWVNFHGGGYLSGIVLLVAYAAGDRMDALGSGPKSAGTKSGLLLRVAGCCLLVSLLNPHGIWMWIYPFQTLFSQAMRTYLMEWYSPDFHMTENWAFLAMLALGIFGFCRKKERVPAADILIFLGSLLASLSSQRHIPLFAVVSAPIIGRCLSSTKQADGGQVVSAGKRVLHTVILSLCVPGLVLSMVYKAQVNELKIRHDYPVDAVNYLQKTSLANARIFNVYGWGGYLIWRGMAPYIDGRADLYGDRFLTRYMEHYYLKPKTDFFGLLKQEGIEVVLLSHDSVLSKFLGSEASWKASYQDGVADVFVKSSRAPG